MNFLFIFVLLRLELKNKIMNESKNFNRTKLGIPGVKATPGFTPYLFILIIMNLR